MESPSLARLVHGMKTPGPKFAVIGKLDEPEPSKPSPEPGRG